MDSIDIEEIYRKAEESNAGTPLSDRQERVLYVLLTVSSLISFVGSYFILKIVWNSKKKKGRLSLYDRLLAALSLCDASTSIFHWIFGAFFMPRGSRVWAFGNDTSCSLFGFTGFALVSSLLYSSMISLYYMLLVRYQFRDEQLGLKFEIPMHMLCILWPVVGYGLSWYLDAYAPRRIGLNCYVSNYPNGCVIVEEDSILEEGQVRCQPPGFIISALPITVACLLILGCNIVLYSHVRTSVKQFQKNSAKRWEDVSRFLGDPKKSLNNSSKRGDSNQETTSKKRWRGHWMRKKDSANNSEVSRVIGNRNNQEQQLRAVMNQSLFYVAATASSLLPVSVQTMIGNQPQFSYENESKLFVFLCFTTFLTPVQGIFNLLIFCRPTYLRIRKAFPDQSRFRCFQRAIEAGTSSTNKKGKSYVVNNHHRQNCGISLHNVMQRWKKWIIDTLYRREKGGDQMDENNDGPSEEKIASRTNESIDSPQNSKKETPEKSGRLKSSQSGAIGSSGRSTKSPEKANSSDQQSKGHRRQQNSSSIDNDIESIQLEMMECSSSSSSSSSLSQSSPPLNSETSRNGDGNTIPDEELAVDRVPEMETIPSRSQEEDRYVRDWTNIEFESSCVLFFSSTTSTIEA